MKTILYYITLAILSINMIAASDLRIASLGGNAGFWPEDDQNIMLFPSTINDFNLAQIQDAAGENPYATFIFGDNANFITRNTTANSLSGKMYKKQASRAPY